MRPGGEGAGVRPPRRRGGSGRSAPRLTRRTSSAGATRGDQALRRVVSAVSPTGERFTIGGIPGPALYEDRFALPEARAALGGGRASEPTAGGRVSGARYAGFGSESAPETVSGSLPLFGLLPFFGSFAFFGSAEGKRRCNSAPTRSGATPRLRRATRTW